MGLKYYVIDVETNGLNVNWHEITQISIIRCEDRSQFSRFIKIKYPERSNLKSLEITGTSKRDLYTRGDAAELVVDAISKWIETDQSTTEGRCFIAHNSSFDRRFCYYLWNSFGKEFPGNLWLCTKELTRTSAKKIGISKPKLTLEASLNLFKVKALPGQHEAISDARNTFLLWKKLVDEKADLLTHIKRHPQNTSSKSLSELLDELDELE